MTARFAIRLDKTLKLVRTSLLEIAYEDEGPRDGRPVMLLHGRYERLLLDGIGHFPHRESPIQVAEAIIHLIQDIV